MNPRTVSARDLETMAFAAHAPIELPGPEGGWATAVINGRFYRARVAPAAVAVTACPFTEDVDDYSMCVCGLPALDHPALQETP